MADCARQVKRVTLELGGKSANIVFADADLDRAAATAPYAVFDNAGQDCCARSRILVQRSVFDRFMELLEPAVKGVAVGDPSRPGHRDGPADLGRAPRTGRVLRAGRRPGGVPRQRPGRARLLVPADRAGPGGPRTTRRSPRRCSARWSPWCRSTDEADAIAIANDTPYGLSGSIWTRDVGRAIRVARAVETGNLSVNSHARSGTGRRSAGSSGPAWAGNSGRTPWTRSPRSRTSSSPPTSSTERVARVSSEERACSGCRTGSP